MLVVIIRLNAQPVITASGFNPVIGDKYKWQTTKYTTSVPPINGANQTWDFSGLIDSGTVTIVSFTSPKGLFYADSFPNANLALHFTGDNNSLEYDITSSKSWGQVGYISLDTTNGRTKSLNRYSPSRPYINYPMTFGTKYIDSVNSYYSHIPPDNYNSSYTYNDSLIGVGYGTLKLPSGTYNNVLCMNLGWNNYWFVANGYHLPLLAIYQDNYNGIIRWNASYYAGVPLPLQITAFSACWRNNNPLLKWTAPNTVNTKAFNIQRSTDGITFNTIGQVAASSSTSYYFEDSYLASGNVYYRLEQLDNDGQKFYSKTELLTVNNAQFSMSPNPAKDFTTINFGKTIDKATIAVYDITGKVVLSKQLDGGTNYYKLNTQTLIKGIYNIKVNTANGSYYEKLLINK